MGRANLGGPEGQDARLNYGAAKRGDAEQAERDWGFPAGWTDVRGSVESRCNALAQSTSVEVAWWIGSALLGKGEES